MKFKTKIDSFGRMVIPKKIRDDLGISKGSEIEIDSKDNKIIIKTSTGKPFIENREGVLVVCSEPVGTLEGSLEKDREDRIKKILGDIEI